MSNIEEKRERFIRVAERRVNKILDALDSLGKCSNRKNYEYCSEDLKKIFGELDKKLREVKLLYRESSERKTVFKL